MEEKSLGCIRKGGTRPIVEVLPETARPTKQGAIIMDTPKQRGHIFLYGAGDDLASVASLVGGGGAVLLCLPQAGEHQRDMRWHQFLK